MLLPFLFDFVLEVLAREFRQEDEIKGIHMAKEEAKLFTDDMISYRENPKNSSELLALINEFSEAARYKINTQNSVLFLYASNVKSKNNQDYNSTYNRKKNILKNKFN